MASVSEDLLDRAPVDFPAHQQEKRGGVDDGWKETQFPECRVEPFSLSTSGQVVHAHQRGWVLLRPVSTLSLAAELE